MLLVIYTCDYNMGDFKHINLKALVNELYHTSHIYVRDTYIMMMYHI